jgi:hypothetical protein
VTSSDGVTTEPLRIVAATGGGTSAIRSISIAGLPVTLPPGESFTLTVVYETGDGLPPNPAPTLSFSITGANPELIRVDPLASGASVTALPASEATGGIYGEAIITVTATQPLTSGATQISASVAVVIADPLPSVPDLTDEAQSDFSDANLKLAPSNVIILPGSAQTPITDINADWRPITHIDSADIYIMGPEGNNLPECFATTGRSAANIIIDVRSQVPQGKKGITPMTYRASVGLSEMQSLFGASAEAILASPLSHLGEIFDVLVIQKEIKQGPRENWYTRLVDGVLTPQRAIETGILDITGGNSLSMTLSYYVLDDALEESFERNGYLIVPDGMNDGWIVDPFWLNRWTERTSQPNSQTGGGSGGGGCDVGAAALILAGAICLLSSRWRKAG